MLNKQSIIVISQVLEGLDFLENCIIFEDADMPNPWFKKFKNHRCRLIIVQYII